MGTDVVTDANGEEVGYLCVVRPSDVEAGQLDLDPNASGNGFGYHVVAFPKTIREDTQGAVLISGSYGSPYNSIQSVHLDIPAGSITYAQTLIDGLNANYIVIQPAYNNPSSINVDVCGPSDPVKALNPNCHDLMRTWVLHGQQECLVDTGACEEIPQFTFGDAQVDQTNSFFNRLETLIGYLDARVDGMPSELTSTDYPNLNWLGHSQGSAHVYLIAKHLYDIERACFLAGPRDYDRINDEYANWFRPVAEGSLTPLDAMFALVSNRDADRAISMSWDYLGIPPNQQRVVEDPPGAQGHRTVFTSPDHTADRQTFCF